VVDGLNLSGEPPHVARRQFAAALNVAMIALTTSLLMWLVAFLDVGGEWFLMWQSKMWKGRKRHSECLPLSVWCFWLWSNASQLPISRPSGSNSRFQLVGIAWLVIQGIPEIA
jgi:hypothetical protein